MIIGNLKRRHNMKVLTALLLAVAVLALLSISVGAAGKFPVAVTDATGKSVTVSSAPQRLISLAPSITEDLYALGLGDRIVGVSDWSDFPEAAKKKPVIGDAFNLNIEKIVELKPDLIVGDLQVVSKYVERLTALGLPIFAINPTDLQGVTDTLILLGKVTGQEEQAATVVADIRKKINSVTAKVKGLPENKRPKVFLEYWNEPLTTAGPGSFPDEVVRLAGGRNVAGDAPSPWPTWSLELLLERDPEVVVLMNRNKDEVLKRAAWKNVNALRAGRVYEVDPNIFSRTSPRLADAVVALAKLLHPALF